MPRVAVIGAGVIGACISYYLARDGGDVLLVDADRPGGLTTGASFAWVNASSKVGRGTYFDLNVAGMGEYERLLLDFPGASWWHRTGHLRWDYPDQAELAAIAAQLRDRRYPVEVLDATQAQRALEPGATVESPSGFVTLMPSEAWVDGPAMVRELITAAIKHGARTSFGSAVRKIDIAAGAIAGIELTGRHAHAVDCVVNAAGPAAPGVSALVGRTLPMCNSPGLAVRVKANPTAIGRVLHAPDIAIRPDGAGRAFLLVRSVEPRLRETGHPARWLVEAVRRKAARVIPELGGAPVVDVRIGHRPILADALPAIGQVSEVAGYYEAVTHSGITLGPFVARALSAEILRGQILPLVYDFRASRFSGDRGHDLPDYLRER